MRTRTLVTRIGIGSTAVAVAALTATQAATAHGGDDDDDKQDFRGTLMELNGSGVSGDVRVVDEDGELRVKVDARGVENMQMHMSHIHGHADLSQASCPDMSMAGADGILSIVEGLPAYGPVFVTIANDHVMKPRLKFDRDFTMTDASSPLAGASVDEMGDLGKFVIVVHGLTAADDGDPANGIVPGYIPALPVACAVLEEH